MTDAVETNLDIRTQKFHLKPTFKYSHLLTRQIFPSRAPAPSPSDGRLACVRACMCVSANLSGLWKGPAAPACSLHARSRLCHFTSVPGSVCVCAASLLNGPGLNQFSWTSLCVFLIAITAVSFKVAFIGTDQWANNFFLAYEFEHSLHWFLSFFPCLARPCLNTSSVSPDVMLIVFFFFCKRVCVFYVMGWTIKNICEARFGEGIRGCMCTHVCTVTCQCTSPLSPAGRLTSCPCGAKAFGSPSLPTRGKERKSGDDTGLADTRANKEKWEALQRMREQRREGECSHLLGLASSLLVWAAFSRHIWKISRLYEARKHWEFWYGWHVEQRKYYQRGGGAMHACRPFCILLGFLENRKWSSSWSRIAFSHKSSNFQAK